MQTYIWKYRVETFTDSGNDNKQFKYKYVGKVNSKVGRIVGTWNFVAKNGKTELSAGEQGEVVGEVVDEV